MGNPVDGIHTIASLHIWPIKLTLFCLLYLQNLRKIPVLPLEGLSVASRVTISTLSVATVARPLNWRSNCFRQPRWSAYLRTRVSGRQSHWRIDRGQVLKITERDSAYFSVKKYVIFKSNNTLTNKLSYKRGVFFKKRPICR